MNAHLDQSERVCWVVTDGRRGIENQALGLAEAVARRTPMRIIRLRTPPAPAVPRPWARPEPSDLSLVEASDPDPFGAGATTQESMPWPDLWIGCGRASLPYSEAARRWTENAAFVVQLQDPLRPARHYDLVIPPEHDALPPASNVLPIVGSPNRVTPEGVDAAAEAAPELASLPSPRVTALIGGDSKRHRFTHVVEQQIGDALEALAEQGASLLITTSRRTPEQLALALKDRFGKRRNMRVWAGDEDGPNPYLALLGVADVVLATKDSINMIAEAASAARPLLLLDVEGRDGKFARFYGALTARGNLRPFSGRLEVWPVEPLTETDRAADEVIARMDARPGAAAHAAAVASNG